MPQSKFLAVIVLALAIVSCTAEQRKQLGGVFDAQEAIAKQYPDGKVSVNLMNGSHLSVVIVNSSANSRNDAERNALARRTAQLAMSKVGGNLDDVQVVFMHQKGFIITYTRTVAGYAFTAAELNAAR